jgi:hypothetical protein
MKPATDGEREIGPGVVDCRDVEIFPDLTDWATVGILLGMVEAERGERFFNLCAQARSCASVQFEARTFMYFSEEGYGQALAQLLLELWGEG